MFKYYLHKYFNIFLFASLNFILITNNFVIPENNFKLQVNFVCLGFLFLLFIYKIQPIVGRFKRSRRIFAIFISAIFVFTAIYNEITNTGTNSLKPNIVVSIIFAVVGIVEAINVVWSRFVPDPNLTRHLYAGTSRDAKKDYLKGRLNVFSKEKLLFVELSGDTEIKSAYRTKELEIDDIGQAVELHDKKFSLLGDPGAGKSTALRNIFSKYALDYVEDRSSLFPLWINLGLSSNPPIADDLLWYWWDRHGLPGSPSTEINNHNLWLFLDGLNEMPDSKVSRKDRARSIRKLTEKYPELPIIATSRIRDYEVEVDIGLDIVIIQPLDDYRMQRFIRKRTGNDDLWNDIKNREPLLRMGRNPYNLVMLTTIHSETNSLPHDLNQLYSEYIRITYFEFTTKRVIRRLTRLLYLPRTMLKKKLHTLAFRMIARGRGTAANVSWAQRHVGRPALKDGINIGVLLVDSGTIKYYHQSIHAYFALPGLSKSLNKKWHDRNPRRRILFIRQLADLQEAAVPAISALIERLQDHEEEIRAEAVIALGAIGRAAPNETVHSLVSVLTDENVKVREEAAKALSHIGGTAEAVPALLEVIRDENLIVRKYAKGTLDKLQTDEVVKAISYLENGLKSNGITRYYSARMLKRAGKVAIHSESEVFKALTSESNPKIRAELVSVFTEVGLLSEYPIPYLARILLEDAIIVKQEALRAVRSAGSKVVWQTRIEISANLYENDDDVRQEALRALAICDSIGIAEAFPAIVNCLYSANINVKTEAVNVLKKAGGSIAASAIPILAKLILDDDVDVGTSALKALEAMDQHALEAVPDIIDALGDEALIIRKTATDVLGKVGRKKPKSVLPQLIEVLRHSDNEIMRYHSAHALSKIAHSKSIPPLISALEDVNPKVRWIAALALGNLRSKEAITPLSQLINDKAIATSNRFTVRDAVISALREIDTPRSREILKRHKLL